MKVNEAKTRLVELLESAGFDLANPNINTAWAAFKEFASEPVECPDDAILFRVGCNDYTGMPTCRFGFVRQFTFNGDAERSHREWLRLELTCNPTPDLVDLLGANLADVCFWSYDCGHKDELYNTIEKYPFLQLGSAIEAWDCEICYDRDQNGKENKDPKPIKNGNRVKSGDTGVLWATVSGNSEDVSHQIRSEALRNERLRKACRPKKWWQFWK